MYEEYIVLLDGDPIRISVKKDINRPNNPDAYEVLDNYLFKNYDYDNTVIDIIRIANCGRIFI